jgi:D-alanyl-D-alanine endopeptidase (penicillin-binding protein 7)
MKKIIAIAALALFGAQALDSEAASQRVRKQYRSASGEKVQGQKPSKFAKSKIRAKHTKARYAAEPDMLNGIPNLKAGSALVLDQGTGQVLYAKNPETRLPIASITKLMTAMVVLDAGLTLDEMLYVSAEDVDMLRGTSSRLKVGAGFTRRDMLLLALMSSENRAASALSRHYPGGSAAFVSAMNIKARLLGMENTRFFDPTGLHGGNTSTAYDLAKMVMAAHSYPLIRELSTSDYHDVAMERRGHLEFKNTNALVREGKWDIGLSKTGFIREAGHCLVMQAKISDRPTVIVLLDSAGKQSRITDALRIRKWMENGRLLVTHEGNKAGNA